MKIGFDISQTGKNKAGCGFVADSLIQSLTGLDHQNQYVLYPYFGTTYCDPDASKTTRKINRSNVSVIYTGSSCSNAMSFWRHFPEDGETILKDPDIIHSHNFYCPVKLKKARLIYTLHDVAFLDHPEYTEEENRWICFNGVFDAAMHADFIMAVSDYSRKRFLHFFPHYPEDRIAAIHLGGRFSEKIRMHEKPLKGLKESRFWLFVGTIEPRKNIRRLLKAFYQYKKKTNNLFPLVMAGGKGWLENDLYNFIAMLGLSDDVILTGYISDENLIWLYRNCYAFVYPSLYEGFGLPVLEAMQTGAAVITSNITSIPEVAGNAAYYVNPENEDEISEAFLRLDNDLNFQETMKENSRQQALRFSWEKCAGEVFDLYYHVMNMPKRVYYHSLTD